MNDPSVRTVQLHLWLERMRAGDLSARDELLRGFRGRLTSLAHKMIEHFPLVQRWAETDDVLQNALLRLLRILEQVQPDSVRGFLNLAAVAMRRELIDLARQFQGPLGIAANHESNGGRGHGGAVLVEPADPRDDPEDLERWQAFHQAVEELPTMEREVVSLIFYHGWTQAEVAQLFQVADRTIRRRWESAMVALHQRLNPPA